MTEPTSNRPPLGFTAMVARAVQTELVLLDPARAGAVSRHLRRLAHALNAQLYFIPLLLLGGAALLIGSVSDIDIAVWIGTGLSALGALLSIAGWIAICLPGPIPFALPRAGAARLVLLAAIPSKAATSAAMARYHATAPSTPPPRALEIADAFAGGALGWSMVVLVAAISALTTELHVPAKGSRIMLLTGKLGILLAIVAMLPLPTPIVAPLAGVAFILLITAFIAYLCVLLVLPNELKAMATRPPKQRVSPAKETH